MSNRRIVIEELCKHGKMQAHGVVGIIHNEGIPACYGGSRTVVTGVTAEVLALELDHAIASIDPPFYEPNTMRLARAVLEAVLEQSEQHPDDQGD